MNKAIALIISCVMVVAFAWAPAAQADTNAMNSHLLPILVNVDATGKVTGISPAYKLRPSFQRLLRNTISKMVTKPAMKNGKAVNSQFVLTLSVLISKAVNGKAQTTLKYLSVKPLPPGTWHWNRNEENRLALSSQVLNDVTVYPPTDMDTIVESGTVVSPTSTGQ